MTTVTEDVFDWASSELLEDPEVVFGPKLGGAAGRAGGGGFDHATLDAYEARLDANVPISAVLRLPPEVLIEIFVHLADYTGTEPAKMPMNDFSDAGLQILEGYGTLKLGTLDFRLALSAQISASYLEAIQESSFERSDSDRRSTHNGERLGPGEMQIVGLEKGLLAFPSNPETRGFLHRQFV